MLSYPTISQNITVNKPLALFREMCAHARRLQLWARFTRHCRCLLDLNETLKTNPVESSSYAGLKTVAINRIRGTQGKVEEFDAEFNPTHERSCTRWVGIAIEKLRGHDLPPVDLIQVGDIYYVRDGHHRISVSRALGQSFIEAEVTVMRLRRESMLR